MMPGCTKPQIIEHTVCQATSVTAPERLYVRAFARTSSTGPVAQWSPPTGAPIGSAVALERYAYTNPIWLRPTWPRLTNVNITGGFTTAP
jgi:hypothetical protein